MATQILNSDAPQATRTLRIESTQLIPNVLPTLSIGDVVKVTVRQNPEEGMGLIFFKGLLVKAQLPKNVAPGDKLEASITERGDQVVFKILDIQKSQLTPPPPKLVEDLSELVRSSSTATLQRLNPLQLSQDLKAVVQVQQQLQKLLTSVATPAQLSDPQQTLNQLTASANGQLAVQLKETAKEIRQFVEQNSPAPAERKMIALSERLSQLITQSSEDNEIASRQIKLFFDALQREVKVAPEKDPVKEVVKQLAKDVKKAKEALQHGDSSQSKAILEQAFSKTQDSLALPAALVEQSSKLDPQTKTDLLQLASRIEHAAAAQESFNQLNPLLQALGEPALVLLPFLFQGLFSHSEVHVENKPKKKRGVQDEDSQGGKGQNNEPYQRIQVSVPLPSMGQIDVDVAHRKDEILVRFSVTDKEINDFLLGELPALVSVLRKQGFERAELITHLGVNKETDSGITANLLTASSIIA